MCIICVEFNKNKDLADAQRMVEAARRETNSISQNHLDLVEVELDKMKKKGILGQLEDETKT